MTPHQLPEIETVMIALNNPNGPKTEWKALQSTSDSKANKWFFDIFNAKIEKQKKIITQIIKQSPELNKIYNGKTAVDEVLEDLRGYWLDNDAANFIVQFDEIRKKPKDRKLKAALIQNLIEISPIRTLQEYIATLQPEDGEEDPSEDVAAPESYGKRLARGFAAAAGVSMLHHFSRGSLSGAAIRGITGAIAIHRWAKGDLSNAQGVAGVIGASMLGSKGIHGNAARVAAVAGFGGRQTSAVGKTAEGLFGGKKQTTINHTTRNTNNNDNRVSNSNIQSNSNTDARTSNIQSNSNTDARTSNIQTNVKNTQLIRGIDNVKSTRETLSGKSSKSIKQDDVGDTSIKSGKSEAAAVIRNARGNYAVKPSINVSKQKSKKTYLRDEKGRFISAKSAQNTVMPSITNTEKTVTPGKADLKETKSEKEDDRQIELLEKIEENTRTGKSADNQNTVVSKISNMFKSVKSVFSREGMKNIFSNVFNKLGGNAVSSFVKKGANVVSSVKNMWSNSRIGGAINNRVSSSIGGAKNVASHVGDITKNIITGISKAFSVKTIAGSVMRIIPRLLVGAGATLAALGKGLLAAVIAGLTYFVGKWIKQGLEKLFPDAMRKFTDWVEDKVNAVLNKFGMGKSPEELKKERANRDAVKPEIQKESAETAKEKVSSVAPERTQDIKTTSAGEAVLAARDSMGDNTENVTNNNSSSVLNNSNSNVSPESIVNNNSSSSNYAAPSSATPNVLRREVKPKSITNSNTSKSSSVTNNVVNAPTTVNNSSGSSGGGKNTARPFDSSFARIQDNKFGRYSFA